MKALCTLVLIGCVTAGVHLAEADDPITRLDAAYGLARARCEVHSCFSTVEDIVSTWCPNRDACAAFVLYGRWLDAYVWCLEQTIHTGLIPTSCAQLFPDATTP